jgi:hypothetical protein
MRGINPVHGVIRGAFGGLRWPPSRPGDRLPVFLVCISFVKCFARASATPSCAADKIDTTAEFSEISKQRSAFK